MVRYRLQRTRHCTYSLITTFVRHARWSGPLVQAWSWLDPASEQCAPPARDVFWLVRDAEMSALSGSGSGQTVALPCAVAAISSDSDATLAQTSPRAISRSLRQSSLCRMFQTPPNGCQVRSPSAQHTMILLELYPLRPTHHDRARLLRCERPSLHTSPWTPHDHTLNSSSTSCSSSSM